MRARSRRKLAFALGFAVYFGILWGLWSTPVVYPLKIFVVLLHELGHAVAAVATGGRVEAILLDPFQGGACECPGGNAFLTLSAGYLGSLGWGLLLLAGAESGRPRPRTLVGGVGAVVLLLTGLYLRGAFALVFGLLFGLGLLGAARWLRESANRALLRIVGLTSCLYVLLDIKSDVLDRPYLRSDAAVLAELTGVPTLVWGVVWLAAATAAIAWTFRWTWKRV